MALSFRIRLVVLLLVSGTTKIVCINRAISVIIYTILALSFWIGFVVLLPIPLATKVSEIYRAVPVIIRAVLAFRGR